MIFRIGDIVRVIKDSGEGLSMTLDYTGIVTSINTNTSLPNRYYVRIRHDGTIHNVKYKETSLEIELDPDRLIYGENLRNAS